MPNGDNTDEPPKRNIPSIVLPSLTSLLVIFIGVTSTKLNWDMTADKQAIAGASAAILIVAALQWWVCSGYKKRAISAETKVTTAETIAPGITKIDPGMEVSSTLSINDPKTIDPPKVITNTSKT